ncbi:hypothetical protein Sme01_20940 [Sphaerisporangium melleum]|uniref:Uncharacterized protein n=1 Tax=Sphaerisporangium melleum TaxID=321316 RepID=A0A917QYP2_9ACTN|nr:hypothetical protein [Sphaerisporangium melleum]GGK76449.1 hypothetical protein GCM10007964_19010 [Sphaerisporangium melleum]GII69618.1 hypothetical protein Sme01_20940 [Sphaerisporangium melleum]
MADVAGNFADLLTPAGMLDALTDLYRALAAVLKGPAQFERIGAVMLSAYSRSGDRLVPLMRQVGRTPFFTDHLVQWNGFDINLGDNDAQRLPELARLWTATRQWALLNRRARAYLYTSYRSHFTQCAGDPPPGGWTDRTDVDLEDVPWSDRAAKAATGEKRGVASEAYGSDGRFSLVCLPVSFFRYLSGGQCSGVHAGGEGPRGRAR